MYGTVELEGIIIKSMNIGEFDRRITIFTKERGKISAFAKGSRRPNSILVGATRPFAYGKFILYEGREAYNLQSANISNYFAEIASDIENTCYATYFLELLDYFTREYLQEIDYLKLIYMALLAIKKAIIPNRLIRRIFELRALVIWGEYENDLTRASDSLRYTWNFIIKTPIEKLFSFTLNEEILKELEKKVDENIKKYVDKKMNALDLLELILN